MNPTQVTAAINQYKNTINELHQTMMQNKKNMDALIFNKDEEINRLKQDCCHKDEEINRLKQEIVDLISGNDKMTIQNLKDNNISFRKSGPFILLS